jgi:Zn-dependent protease with chaperone function
MSRIPTAIIALVLVAISDLLAAIPERHGTPAEIGSLALLTAALPAALVAWLLRGPAVHALHARRAAWLATAGPLFGFAALLILGAAALVEHWIPPQLPGAAAATLLLPLFAGWALAHWPRCRFENRRDALEEPVLRSVARELRPVAVLFGVSIAFGAISDLGWSLPRLRESLLDDPLLSVAAVFGMVALIGILSPRFVRALHPARPLPAGPLRSRLEETARAAGVGVREIYLWDTGPRPAMNACVCGLFPTSRTVFITDGLLAQLGPAEVEGVFAHELAHGTLHHLWIYTSLVLGLAGVAAGVTSLAAALGLDAGDGRVAAMLLLPIGGLFLVFFGTLSRHFESQADLYSAERTGSPFGIVSALGRIGELTGTLHRRRGWRHPAIPERIATVLSCAASPERRAAFRRRTRRLVGIAAAVAVAGLGGWTAEVLGALSAPEWKRDLSRATYLIVADHERTQRPWSDPIEQRESLQRAAALATRSLSPLAAEGRSRELVAAYQLLEQAYQRLGDPWSEAAARFLWDPEGRTLPRPSSAPR